MVGAVGVGVGTLVVGTLVVGMLVVGSDDVGILVGYGVAGDVVGGKVTVKQVQRSVQLLPM